MLYQLHELQRAFLNPISALAGASALLYTHPASPLAYTPVAQRMAANCELVYRLGKEYEKPAFGIDSVTVNGREIEIFQETVLKKSFCQLLHFKKNLTEKEANKLKQPVVLIFAPLSGHHATLLRDTVRTLLQDHDVFITDWVDARMVPLSEGDFHLDDYVAYVQEFITHLSSRVNKNVSVISVCQPTVPVLAGISLMASAKSAHMPRCMVMMGGPIDARNRPTSVNTLATEKDFSWFENTVIYRVPGKYPGAGRRVYPGFLQHAGFMSMNRERHAQSHWDFYLDLVKGDDETAETHRKFYDEYNAVLDMSADYYLDTIKIVFQDFALATGTWKVAGKLVRPQDIKNVALFTIEGELDDISGLGQTEAAHVLCSGIAKTKKKHYVAPDCGHYGIFSGRRWREMVYPKIKAFIAANQ